MNQINALGQIQGLKTLTIEHEGNPLLQLSLWRMYAVYRLGPTIELINGAMVRIKDKSFTTLRLITFITVKTQLLKVLIYSFILSEK